MIPPCYECAERSPTCHGSCERYAAFVQKCEAARKKRKQNCEMLDARRKGIERNLKRIHKKGWSSS